MRRYGTSVPAILLLTALVGHGCGETDSRSAADEAAGGDFCARVSAEVERFVTRMEEERPTPDDPRYGGTAVLVAGGELVGGMNGLSATDYSALQHQNFVNLMTLIEYDEQLTPVPSLARSFEVDDDTTAVTFRLRDDVYWHDGVKTTAHDVAFTYLRATDPETGFPNAAFWDHYVRGPAGVEVTDSLTVTIRLQRPHTAFMDPWRTLSIMPAHLLEDVPPAELAQHPFGTRCPVGNGPFVFEEHRPQESWTFRANPAFPEELGGRPFLDRYVYRVVPEASTRLTELLTERADVYHTPPPSQAERILRADHVRLMEFLFRDFVFVVWNSRREQLEDSRVRRALTMGLDREAIADALLEGYGRVANSTVPPFHWAYDPTLEDELPHDPESARKLLDAAGWIDRDGDGVRENEAGTALSVTVETNRNEIRMGITEIMQAQLREIGVEITPRVSEFASLLARVNDPESRDFDAMVLGFMTEFRIDDRDLFHSGRLDQPYAWAGTRNPELDTLLDTLQLVTDREAALPLWREYQRELVEEQPFTFLYYRQRLDAVNTRLNGVEMDIRGEWISIRDWWIDPEERRGRR